MTKNERIKAHDEEIILITETLQNLVKTNQGLMESVESLEARIALLEARPMYPWSYTTPESVTPPFLGQDDNITVTYPSWAPAFGWGVSSTHTAIMGVNTGYVQ
jgi:hypothetical protein